jgi:hypothetical protein
MNTSPPHSPHRNPKCPAPFASPFSPSPPTACFACPFYQSLVSSSAFPMSHRHLLCLEFWGAGCVCGACARAWASLPICLCYTAHTQLHLVERSLGMHALLKTTQAQIICMNHTPNAIIHRNTNPKPQTKPLIRYGALAYQALSARAKLGSSSRKPSLERALVVN